MDPNLAAALVPLAVVLGLDLWVYSDARARQGTRREVRARIGSLEIDRPQWWLAGCVVLFVLVFPLYLVARRASV